MLPVLSRLPTPAAFTITLLLFHFLFTILGLGATLLVIPVRLFKYVLIFAPVIGLILVSWLGWHSVWRGSPGTETTAALICLICCSLLFVQIFRGRVFGGSLFDMEVLVAFAIALCGTLALSLPAMGEPNLTTISAGNNDPASYALAERFLMLHSLNDAPGNLGQYFDIRRAAEPIFGVLFGSALAGSVLKLDSYQLQNVATSAFVLWGALAFYVLAREAFGFKSVFAVILLASYSLNESIAYLAMHGFKSQLAAMPMAAGLYSFLLPALRRDAAPEGRELAGATLLSWGIVAVYPHMLPAVFLPPGLYSLALAVRARSFRRLAWPALTAILVLAGTFALAPARTLIVYQYAGQMKQVVAGWFLPWLSPEAFVGLSTTSAFSHVRWPFEALLGLIFAVLVIIGLIRVKRADSDIFLVALSILCMVGAAYGFLIVTGREEELGGYKSFKLLSFFAPPLWCSLLLFLRDAHPDRRLGLVQAMMAIALVTGNLIWGGRWVTVVQKRHASVTPEVADLTRLEADPRVRSVNVLGSDWWTTMWATTFLFHKVLHHAHDTYYPASPLVGEWSLEDDFDRILKVRLCGRSAGMRINDRFNLVPAAEQDLSAEWDRGWYGDERTHRWTAEQTASIRIRAGTARLVKVGLDYTVLRNENPFAVLVNGTQLGACKGAVRCDLTIELSRGDNRLDFVGTRPPEKPDNGDPRRVGIAFSAILIEQTGCPSG